MGDECIYECVVVLCVVISMDVMIVDWVYFFYEFMVKVLNDIINKVKGVNCVCYDILFKLFVIIEWE